MPVVSRDVAFAAYVVFEGGVVTVIFVSTGASTVILNVVLIDVFSVDVTVIVCSPVFPAVKPLYVTLLVASYVLLSVFFAVIFMPDVSRVVSV